MMSANANALIVTARTYRDDVNLGVSAFLVGMDDPGIATSGIGDTGWKPMGRSMVHIDEVRVTEDAVLGAEGGAFRSVLNGFDCTRPLLALTGIGCAQASLDDTAAYVRERSAFGSPLARFEGVSFPFEQRLRDVLALEIADGTARVQKIIVARELFGSVFVPYRSG